MKKSVFFLFFFLNIYLFRSNCAAQKAHPTNGQYLGISIGRGYEDALVSLSRLPTLGIMYSRTFTKRVSMRIGITSFYRSMPDYYLYEDPFGHLVSNLVVRDSRSPHITDADRDKITRVGIKDLNSSFTIKILSVPLDFGVMLRPIVYKRHNLGIFIGASLSFESQNFWRDYYPADLTLKDGTVYPSSYLALNTEFRSLSFGECLKIEYMYHFNRCSIALTASENNALLGHRGSIIFNHLSIGLHAKI